MFVDYPIRLTKGGRISAQTGLIQSIKDFLDLMAATAHGTFKADGNFGFVFRNYRFENFNVAKNSLFSSGDDEPEQYKKKIQGNSNNLNTFAYDFKKCIDMYEPRLKKAKVVMDYQPKNKLIVMTITGELNTQLSEPFSHNILIHIW